MYVDALESATITQYPYSMSLSGMTKNGPVYTEREDLIIKIMHQMWARLNPGLGI